MFLLSKEPLSFPYEIIKTELGKIPYPVVSVLISGKKRVLEGSFIVDTGADIATLPIYLAYELGVDLKKLPTSSIQGVGQRPTKTYEAKINIQIGPEKFPLKCSFINNNKIPPLLGKIGIFNRFSLYFDNKNQKLVFKRLKKNSIFSFLKGLLS